MHVKRGETGGVADVLQAPSSVKRIIFSGGSGINKATHKAYVRV